MVVCALFNSRKDSATLKLQSQEVVGNNLNSNFWCALCSLSAAHIRTQTLSHPSPPSSRTTTSLSRTINDSFMLKRGVRVPIISVKVQYCHSPVLFFYEYLTNGRAYSTQSVSPIICLINFVQFCNEGSTNFRSSAVEDHARSETHLRAVRATQSHPNVSNLIKKKSNEEKVSIISVNIHQPVLYFLFDVYTFKSGGPDLTYPPKRLEQSASRRFGGGVSTSFYSPTTTPAPPNIRAKPLRPCILTKAHIITSRGRESRLNLYSDVVIPPPPLYLIPHFFVSSASLFRGQ